MTASMTKAKISVNALFRQNQLDLIASRDLLPTSPTTLDDSEESSGLSNSLATVVLDGECDSVFFTFGTTTTDLGGDGSALFCSS